ncbi:MAG TPA: type I-E CRISPR-associated protein Cas6/Cse3/CasE [Candidatus Hydrogenedentes bacterium]|nr:type I-E CRISPR-associated protein Cas6/Cse3/CasE [Candidatus Hydrogenedentota bacterium]HPG65205.1 type I-E CRISPR-associated protein Cas6/Cse3/CasE [Candidatus Hydrogenedentota bacterium]
MYLSHLLIDVGANPDRPRPGRLWLRNIYHVHQRLCMAFPKAERVHEDPLFLKPYAPGDFPEDRHEAQQEPAEIGCETLKHVHALRSPESGFLFRIDPLPTGAAILVLSAAEPNWEYAFQNARMLLAAEAEVREYCPAYSVGEKLRFRILMNLSKKSTSFRGESERLDAQGRARTQGKRISLTWAEDQKPEDVIVPWFERKGSAQGFTVHDCVVVRMGWIAGCPPGKKQLRFRSGLLEGTLSVTDASAFGHALTSGVGSGKAFGFGLLTVLPIN